MAQREIRRFPGGDNEFADMGPALRGEVLGARAGPSDRAPRPPADFHRHSGAPTHDRTIIETDDELGAQFNAAAYAAHETYEMRTRRPRSA